MSTPYPIEEISEAEVNQAQRDWCNGLIEICEAYPDGDYRGKAIAFIERLYDFEGSRVFFRPTLAKAPQNFRTTKEGALAYFIGEDDEFPLDEGFIKQGYVWADFDNEIEGKAAIQVHDNIGIAMGNVYLRKAEVTVGGKATVVDKLFVFMKRKGLVRLIVHNSALSNMPDTEVPEDPKEPK
ncbi:MAG TPA: hypothetical protein VN724_15035 [Pyrinomonadaceae bacterium]|jgi:hypothetical protein|nr:hypothetical protein [Pyrinomonadaceae bacterium]